MIQLPRFFRSQYPGERDKTEIKSKCQRDKQGAPDKQRLQSAHVECLERGAHGGKV